MKKYNIIANIPFDIRIKNVQIITQELKKMAYRIGQQMKNNLNNLYYLILLYLKVLSILIIGSLFWIKNTSDIRGEKAVNIFFNKL